MALDLCSFLLRYHRALDYGDFSENPYCVQRLRRYEDFKCWSEIEDVAVLSESNAKDLINFKQNNESALQEILQHLERIVRDCVTKDELEHSIKAYNRGNTFSQAATSLGSGLPLDSNQYKRVLELMLELERKVETRFDDIHTDMRREVNKLTDERHLR